MGSPRRLLHATPQMLLDDGTAAVLTASISTKTKIWGQRAGVVMAIHFGSALLFGCGREGPDAPRRSWRLPDGGKIEFFATLNPITFPPDSTKSIVWTRADGVAKTFVLDSTHGGYGHVELMLVQGTDVAWFNVRDTARSIPELCAVLDLRTGDFFNEHKMSHQRAWPETYGGATGQLQRMIRLTREATSVLVPELQTKNGAQNGGKRGQ